MNELALASFAAANDAHLVGEPGSARFAAFKARFDARAELERLDALGFRFLERSSPGFPPLLGAIHDPPPGLFLRGPADPQLLARPGVAIVGARACSPYGRQISRMLGRELAAAGRSSSAASPAASMRRRTAARSRQPEQPWRCLAAESTATIRRRTAS